MILSICSIFPDILFTSSVKSLIPRPSNQYCVGTVVYAVEEIEKSTLLWGKGGEMFPRRRKSNFTAKCLNTFVAHCRFDPVDSRIFMTHSIETPAPRDPGHSGDMHFTHNYRRTLSAFPCGRIQHVRRMGYSIVTMIQSVLKFRLGNLRYTTAGCYYGYFGREGLG